MKLPRIYDSMGWHERKLVLEEYVRRQGGLCMYCSKSLSEEPVMDRDINWNLFPKGFLDYPVHLDHDHSTGLTRGAVHGYCNAVMWQHEGK